MCAIIIGRDSVGGIIMADEVKDLMEDIEALQYNWNIINLCYQLWKDDITKSHNGMEIELVKIAGVGENYIPSLCNGKVKTTKRIFNCETSDINILMLLQGKTKISFRNSTILEKKIKEYIVLNDIYKTIIGDCRRGKDADNKKKKLIEMCGTKDYKKYIGKLKSEILILIGKEDIRTKKSEQETFEYTSIGLIKQFLLGKNAREDVLIFGEEEVYITNVLSLLLQIKTDKLAKFSNKNLNMMYLYVKTLEERVMAEVNYRKVKDYERELSSDVIKAYSDKEEEKYKKHSKQEDLDWE